MIKDTPVFYIMTKELIIATTGHKLSQIQKFFLESGIQHLPVVDSGQLVGILSGNDVFRFYANNYSTFNTEEELDREFSCYAEMTKNPVTINSRTPIMEAAQIFAEKGFHALPVVDDGSLVGIVTSMDVIRYMSVQ